MYGLIGKMRAATGKRDEVLAILREATTGLPGCLSYIVARDPADTTAIWITEVWTDAESHKASLTLPEVQAAIARARPLVTGFDIQIETEPVSGVSMPAG
ncbi:putative quinol monooxygenase [Ollibium composti]|jgi:quinol monooxygenase YgiN|uniref:Antibiotic biosynthesis monooxygenase n=1 Tax=Ollibium composti TaxID=2675109 RepID=A0ABY2Q6P2_9HYPH|nr:putative quinol monooxygenase [Mesorhizobium composti]THF56122.1 antibiotic biosynthesis monooxygenase [Mesorhizobium composti]